MSRMDDEHELQGIVFSLIRQARLSEKEEWVLAQRFGLNSGSAKRLEEVAADFYEKFEVAPVSREQIRRFEANALRKIRATMKEDLSEYDWLINSLPHIKLLKALK